VGTPRRGKPVDIEGLWCNALRIRADLRQRQGRAADAVALRADAERAGRRFVELFWNPGAGCLHDCIDQRGGAPPIEVDDRIRPNQILALSLPFELLTPERAASVLGVVESKLLTPVGLRSLAPDHPDYGARYEGGPAERDSVYHQGPVWSWLLGPYITALVRVRGDAGRVEARRLLEAATAHLAEGCVGSVSEIFDGDPPHRPRGCPAQAWGVSEWLRAALEEASMGEAEPSPGQRAAMCEEELQCPDDVAVLAAEDNREKRKAAAATFTPDPLAPPRRPGA
jgi:glycogen debranching enzyme